MATFSSCATNAANATVTAGNGDFHVDDTGDDATITLGNGDRTDMRDDNTLCTRIVADKR